MKLINSETKSYNKYNFHSHTFCIWKEVAINDIRDLDINFKSKSGSQYIFNELGVYRISNHWGRAANCRWRLESNVNYKNQHATIGFAYWNEFYPNDENSKLYFIKVNFEEKEVTFHHKLSKEYDGKALVRTPNETAKTIKLIKSILTENAWHKHLYFDDVEKLKLEIITLLTETNLSFLEIKQKYIKTK